MKKDFVDENGVTTKLKTSNLVKDVVPSVLKFLDYSYTSTDCSATAPTRADNKACSGMCRNLGQLQCCIQYLKIINFYLK